MSEHDPTPREAALLTAAQQVVDEWLSLRSRPPFAGLLRYAERYQLPHLRLTEQERVRFSAVANAIRAGDGHAVHHPGPLVALLREGPPALSHESECSAPDP
jgi:hypothetical protein